jgi:predicted small metal-binding protein
MKKISCKDIDPSIDCMFETTGQNTKDVVNTMMAHLRSDHADKVKGMNDGEIRTMIESKVSSA